MVCDAQDGTVLRKYPKVCQNWVVTGTWINDGMFACGGKPEVLKIFSTNYDKPVVEKYGFGQIIWSMVAHEPKGFLFLGGYDGAVACYSLNSGEIKWIKKDFTLSVYALSFNEVSNALAAGGKNKVVKFYSAENGDSLQSFKDEPFLSKIQFLKWAPGIEGILVAMSEWEVGLVRKEGKSVSKKGKFDLLSAAVDWKTFRVFVGDSMGGFTVLRLY
jgi:WD40 repeat protein